AVLGREAYVGGGMQQWREAKALWDGPEAHKEYLERSHRDAYELPIKLDLDMVRSSYWRMSVKPTKKIDECTFLYGDPEKDWHVMRLDPETELYQIVARSPKPERTMADLEKEVEAQEKSVERYQPTEAAYAETVEAMKAFPDRAVPGGGVGININYREHLWLEAIALRPDLVRRALAFQAERAARACPVMARVGLRFIQGGGDFASNSGPFYSPRAFHELTFPALKKVSDACHQHGLFHMFASDGNLWPVADDLFGAAGVDAFYEIDGRAGMDLAKLRQRFPHLTLLGNISSFILHRGTKAEVIAETRACLEAAKQYGSIIVGCSNQIVSQTPIENFWAMMDTLHKHR
ncbi:MAG: hypothetical protein FJ272_22980, partial [Planctomycetes bacterium]|nr:hypothetical protein [Planctomycetota bacterium]